MIKFLRCKGFSSSKIVNVRIPRRNMSTYDFVPSASPVSDFMVEQLCEFMSKRRVVVISGAGLRYSIPY
jgi:hypothetical protein